MSEPKDVSLQTCIVPLQDTLAWILSQIIPHLNTGFHKL